jgi:hypothetical protein
MSISNHSVDVKASTADLESLLNEYEASYDRIMDLPDDQIDDAQLEWLESGIEIIEGELEKRVSPDYPVDHDDDSLEDRGLHLGSYAS